ncbi:MAG TPA: glutamine-hydrolyzing carbamoyl-phosphate synthase small subunit [Limnochordia bacterium]|nr:glutamine-hydrolyzing carbamoyl-phosphate synthase small subunit [Limnochordia bacterium]
MAKTTVPAALALEDGSVYRGQALGAPGLVGGEVVFNTSMTGYQEILTDPSYQGEIVTMTYPLQGNYGVNRDDFESELPHAHGFIVREACSDPSNWRQIAQLESFLREHEITGIAGIDTRALTRTLREHGTMRGVIATGEVDADELVDRARALPDLSQQDLVAQVTPQQASEFAAGPGPHVAVVDCGSKLNIMRELARRGCRVTRLPAQTTAAELSALAPDGVVFSNGPGDPKSAPYVIATAQSVIGRVPVMGICLGHQIVALAMGGDTYKLKYGHRGANHPVKDLASGRVYITSQNHGFAVDPSGWERRGMRVSHKNLNDETVEGLAHESLPLFSVQYHPEASPGPKDSEYLFDEFLARIEKGR